MANARKPDNVHKLNGTYQKHRHGEPDTKPEWDDGLPKIPSCLKGEARKEWKRIIEIVPAGVLTLTDKTVLTQYCALWAELEADPANFETGQHTQLRLIQQELGFTPISRGKIGGKPKGNDEGGFQSNPR